MVGVLWIGATLLVGIGPLYTRAPGFDVLSGSHHRPRGEITVPPTIHELLADPVMRMYYKTRPTIPRTLEWGEPWMVWATDHEGKWGRKMFESYTLAWEKVVKIYRDPDRYRDVALVSRRLLFPPPLKATWRSGYDWCSRCRRPSEFRERSPEHHALRTMPVLTEDAPRRCYYCGIRRAAMPHYSGRGNNQ